MIKPFQCSEKRGKDIWKMGVIIIVCSLLHLVLRSCIETYCFFIHQLKQLHHEYPTDLWMSESPPPPRQSRSVVFRDSVRGSPCIKSSRAQTVL